MCDVPQLVGDFNGISLVILCDFQYTVGDFYGMFCGFGVIVSICLEMSRACSENVW